MANESLRILTIVLAAGQSSRMGCPKPLLTIRGVSFLRRIVNLHLGLGLPVCVVLGEHRQAILREVDLSETLVVTNPRPDLGQLSSLQVGLAEAAGYEAVIVHPVDHPLVSAATIQALLAAHALDPESILTPERGGRTGHPTLFPREFYEDLGAAPLDQGARYVMSERRRSVHRVPAPDDGIFKNIDTLEDYRRWVGEP
jgi:molybdenum cofactor cytidylyltransferase